ncbi:MAG TPA: hypothetical protein VN175_13945 [Rhizomicrobium sp.]|jgi:hypothetical protein|nr:hypothetical protein [Rhizomicrobium sp.]
MRHDQHANDTGEKMWCSRLLISLVTCCALASGPAAAQNAAQQKPPSEAATISEFIASCDQNSSQCEYKMRMAALNKINTRGAVSICLTDDHPQKPVIAWLKAHPETHAMATDDGLYTAYKSLYPCP